MIYRFEILTEDAVYECWAESKDKMKERFCQEHPGEDFEVFFCGGCPKVLTLSEYREALYYLGHIVGVRILDARIAKILGMEIDDEQITKLESLSA